MRVLVIGAGAVGSFIGARLSLAGHEVTLVGRPTLVQAVRRGGLTLLEPDGSRRIADVAAALDIAAAFRAISASSETGCSPEAYDLALITVKAYDTAAVIAELATAVAVPPPLLTLQNGVGNEEALAEVFGGHRVVAGAIDTPISVPTPGQVQIHRARFRAGIATVQSGQRTLLRRRPGPNFQSQAGRRPSAQAEAPKRGGAPGPNLPVETAARLLRDAGFQVDIFDDHRRLKWTKLLLNLPANAQCAILDWTPAQVMADPTAARLEALAWQEALAVMAALDIRPVTLAGYPVGLIAPIARRLPAAWLAAGLRQLVSGGRGSKMPSLHMALAAGKRSEVSWLNGAVAYHGTQLGIPTPVNLVLTDTLMALTEGQVSWDAWRGQPAKLAAVVQSRQGRKNPTLT